MRKNTMGAQSPARPGATARTSGERAELRELLDHLGHLLAREYIALLRDAPRTEAEPKPEGQE
jgi:hypothetical protein